MQLFVKKFGFCFAWDGVGVFRGLPGWFWFWSMFLGLGLLVFRIGTELDECRVLCSRLRPSCICIFDKWRFRSFISSSLFLVELWGLLLGFGLGFLESVGRRILVFVGLSCFLSFCRFLPGLFSFCSSPYSNSFSEVCINWISWLGFFYYEISDFIDYFIFVFHFFSLRLSICFLPL